MRQAHIDSNKRQRAPQKRQLPTKVPSEDGHFEQLIIMDKVVDHFTFWITQGNHKHSNWNTLWGFKLKKLASYLTVARRPSERI